MRRPLRSARVLLTVGPTREPLDPVRFLSNHSSGEMGLTLAERLADAGARVTVVLGPVSRPVPKGLRVIPVETARAMWTAVMKELDRSDAFIATAAVCDWRFEKIHSQKMKKGAATAMTVRLVRNPDILAEAGERKKRSSAGPLLVGFALETRNLAAYALKKLSQKNLDLVIGNSPTSFGSPRIAPLWIEKEGRTRRLPSMTKNALSSEIVRWLSARLPSR